MRVATWGASSDELQRILLAGPVPQWSSTTRIIESWRMVEPHLREVREHARSTGHSRKRALIITVSYWQSTKYKTVQGSPADLQLQLRRLLDQSYTCEFLSDSHLGPNSNRYASLENIRDAIRRLVRDCQKGDELVFVCHGVKEWNEAKGTSILTADEHFITSHELNTLLVSNLHGASLTALFDCCESVDPLELPWRIDFDDGHSRATHLNDTTVNGSVVCIGASEGISKERNLNEIRCGALTWAIHSYMECPRTRTPSLQGLAKFIRGSWRERQFAQYTSSTNHGDLTLPRL